MKHITVISGGTATNNILDSFNASYDEECTVTYILPVSDNGGSSSEILRVLGGCAIGDIRSRLVRLIPTDEEITGTRGLKGLLSYRLDIDAVEAKKEWTQIVDGSHSIWSSVEPGIRELMRSFLIHVDMEIHKRSRLGFKLELASVGNLFLTGCRLFFGDLDSGIELVSRICRIDQKVTVAGCLNTNFTYHIAAVLENGDLIRGQSQISHPSIIKPINCKKSNKGSFANLAMALRSVEDLVSIREEDGDIHPSLQTSQLHFNKDTNQVPPLESPISRVFYISPYGEEIHPKASVRTLRALGETDAIIYSIGSLWTSLVPVLLLRGVGANIIEGKNVRKILLLNSTYDRETFDMDLMDFMKVIKQSIEYSAKVEYLKLKDVVTDVIYAKDGEISVTNDNINELEQNGINCHPIPGTILEAHMLRKTLRETLHV